MLCVKITSTLRRQFLPAINSSLINQLLQWKEFYLVEIGQRTGLKIYSILPTELVAGTLLCISKVSNYLNLNNFSDQV